MTPSQSQPATTGSQQATVSGAASGFQTLEQTLSSLISKYSDWYEHKDGFAANVNKGLPVRWYKRAYLGTLRTLGYRTAYRSGVESVISHYLKKLLEEHPDTAGNSAQVLQQLGNYLDLTSSIKDLDAQAHASAVMERQRHQTLLQEKERAKQDAERKKQDADWSAQNRKQALDHQLSRDMQEMERQQRESARKDIESTVKDDLITMGYLKEDQDSRTGQHGARQLRYDDNRLVDRLSDIFLDDILDKIEQHSGGMRAFLQGNKGVHFMDKGRLCDEAEISRIDPVASLVHARMSGQDSIEPETAIVRKAQTEGIHDAVIALDISGSMNDNNKIEIAKRTGLAFDKMLQRQNPANKTRYVVFGNGNVQEVNVSSFYTTKAGGDTPMAGAMDMGGAILSQGNSDARLLYVISDCYPNVGDTMKSAEKLAEDKNLYLRLILIGIEPGSVNEAKAITEAAGKNAKILPVRADKVDMAVFEDYFNTFSGLVRPEQLEAYL